MIALYLLVGKTHRKLVPLIDRAEPVVEKIRPLIDRVEPELEKVRPLIEKVGAMVATANQVLEENRPRIAELSAEALAIVKRAASRSSASVA